MHGVKPAAIAAVGLLVSLPLISCSSDAIAPIWFGRFGPLSGDSGRGSFRFGVATAATQIEDMNTATDWYLFADAVRTVLPQGPRGEPHEAVMTELSRSAIALIADPDHSCGWTERV